MKIIDFCKTIHPISLALEEALLKNIQYKTILAGNYFLNAGNVANYACLVTNGLLRSFYIKDEEEITTKFLGQNAWVTSIYSFYSRKPSQEYIKAITETSLECVHHLKMQEMLNTHAELNYIVRVITEQYLLFSEIEIYNLRKQNAEERYRFFLKHHSQLLQDAPLKYIASYLNMTVETLSRIRSKVGGRI